MASLHFAGPPKPPPPPEDDSLADLAAAPPTPGRSTTEAIRRKKRKQRRVRLIAGSLVLAGLAAAGAVGVYVARPALLSDKEKKQTTSADTTDIVPRDLRRRMRKVEERWKDLQSADLPEEVQQTRSGARSAVEAMRAAWEAKEYEKAEKQLAAAKQRIKKIENVALYQREAVAARKRTERLRKKAKKAKAPERAATLWKDAKEVASQAETSFADGSFKQASSQWEKAAKHYGEALDKAKSAANAKSAKSGLSLRLGLNYERQVLKQAGGDAWAKLKKTMDRAEAALSDGNYAKAKKLFNRARDNVSAVERAVRRNRGVHYYALRAGYLASDILFQRAGGGSLSSDAIAPLKKTLANLRLSESVRKRVVGAKDDAYSSLADTLLKQIRKAIERRRGPKKATSFNIGTHARILEGLLAKDRETLDQGLLQRVRSACHAMEKRANAVGYPSPITETIQGVRKDLQIDPAFEAIRRARQRWDKFVKKLDEYESGKKVVPPATDA